ncbi:MAG TPA: adenylate/guanylate cyclase domain-containing protein, partial [Leptospiraceae bacterium]|nr:adenylate/guanylate cyclase domain-containing protein [Leptospiraceae bacterium]
TVISDSVNLASRIEGLTKYFGASLLVSGETFRLVRHKEKFHYRILDTVKVKGKSSSVQVVEIFDGFPKEKAALYIKTKSAFESAVAEYQNREFSKCIIEFQKILEINPNDKASQIYLNRAKHFLEFGVPDEWTGIESMTEK